MNKKKVYKCPYCGKEYDTYQQLGGHKGNCAQKDEHRKIDVEMIAGLSVGDDDYLNGETYTVTKKFYNNHDKQMKPVRKTK